jgi:tetratricopeptide (TPR) repeat protein
MALGVAVFADGARRAAVRWAASAVVLLVVSAAAVVATRGTLLGIGAALAAVFLLRLRVDRARSERRLGGVFALTIAAVAVLLLLASSPLGARAARTVNDLGSGRVAVYRVVASAFIDRPITGYGPDSLGTVYARFQDSVSDGLGSPQTSAHNWILQTLVTTGVVGLGAQLVLLVSFAVALWKSLARVPAIAAPLALASVAYWANALVDVGAISVDWLPWFAFGATASLVGRRPAAPARRAVPMFVMAVIAVAAIAAAASGANAYLANRSAQTARSALAASDAARAVDAATAAVRADPGRADYWNWLGLSLETSGTAADAAAAYAEAARRAPYEATYWGNLALVRAREATRGGGDPALKSSAMDAARRCVAADPMSWEAHELLAKVAFQIGDYEAALESALVAYRFGSIHDDPSTIASKSASALSSRTALEHIEHAIAYRETALLHLAAAGVAERLGDKATAVAHARRVLVLEPGNEEARRIVTALGP